MNCFLQRNVFSGDDFIVSSCSKNKRRKFRKSVLKWCTINYNCSASYYIRECIYSYPCIINYMVLQQKNNISFRLCIAAYYSMRTDCNIFNEEIDEIIKLIHWQEDIKSLSNVHQFIFCFELTIRFVDEYFRQCKLRMIKPRDPYLEFMLEWNDI